MLCSFVDFNARVTGVVTGWWTFCPCDGNDYAELTAILSSMVMCAEKLHTECSFVLFTLKNVVNLTCIIATALPKGYPRIFLRKVYFMKSLLRQAAYFSRERKSACSIIDQ